MQPAPKFKAIEMRRPWPFRLFFLGAGILVAFIYVLTINRSSDSPPASAAKGGQISQASIDQPDAGATSDAGTKAKLAVHAAKNGKGALGPSAEGGKDRKGALPPSQSGAPGPAAGEGRAASAESGAARKSVGPPRGTLNKPAVLGPRRAEAEQRKPQLPLSPSPSEGKAASAETPAAPPSAPARTTMTDAEAILRTLTPVLAR